MGSTAALERGGCLLFRYLREIVFRRRMFHVVRGHIRKDETQDSSPSHHLWTFESLSLPQLFHQLLQHLYRCKYLGLGLSDLRVVTHQCEAKALILSTLRLRR